MFPGDGGEMLGGNAEWCSMLLETLNLAVFPTCAVNNKINKERSK